MSSIRSRISFPVLLVALSTLLGSTAWAQPADLFMSQYIEGSSNNKAIEIYNGTSSAVDLATGQYVLQMYFNGNTAAGLTISLTGTVAAGDVYVIAHSSANATILAQADQTNGSGWFNGDDAVVLRKGGSAGTILDVIGQIGTDPGTQWGSGLQSTADNTLRRKVTVCTGDTDGSNAFDPAAEWDGYAQDDTDGLGSHGTLCELFISEYIEGSSNNKAIEIYNGTSSPVDLATGQYVLQMYFNGNSSAGLSISLTGTVAAGDVYVVAQSSASATILAQADQTNGSGWFNGDDAVVLRKGGTTGSIVDVIGQIGFDPGSQWGSLDQSTADNTLRRKTSVCKGDTDGSNVFDPAIEWDGFATDTFDGLGAHTATCSSSGGGGGVTLSIDDVTRAEGDSLTTTFSFTVTLSAPAPTGGVTFDIATADGTATTADSDYVARSLTGQTIAAGNTTYTFDVTVNGDTSVEASETFFVNVTNVTGATVSDGQGLGTISNDDVTIVPIHDIQGSGASSPLVGATVTTTGVVTGLKSNGFFIQTPDASVDADTMTSEGIFVFTSSAPPAAAAVGALVQVTGNVAEFTPSSDPLQPPLTELTSPAVVQLSTGNPLPTPVALTTSFPSPTGAVSQLERVEGMRVSVASLTVTAPTLGNVSEANATATSSGVYFGVVTGLSRPFREPGIQADDPAPAGSIPPIPRWDFNPELLRVDSDGQTGATAIDVAAGAVVTGLVGPLDYGFRRYTILPDPASPPAVSGGPTPIGVSTATDVEFTVASYNLERFFDDVNDPAISEPVLTSVAFDRRLAKASLGIREYLGMPDIIGVVEVENLTALQALATRISADALAASQPDPLYAAYLVEGNDVGGIDVGFLVKTATVAGITPRVSVSSVTQELAGTLLVNPDLSTSLLNDRPPLVLEAVVNHSTGATYPVTVIVNHLRSLNDVESTDPGSNGWATVGDRVRAKRQKQAEDLANLVQTRQLNNPSENIVLVGDFNAFEFNDGFGDSMGVIAGTPSPDDQTVVPGDGVDLVNPDFTNLVGTAPAAERYSFVFDGNAQSLDHVLVNGATIASTTTRREEHARINADFPEVARNDGSSVARLADHDPLVAYFAVDAFSPVGISIDDVTVIEGTSGFRSATFTVSLARPGSVPITVDFATAGSTATAGVDFNSTSGTLTFTPPTVTQQIVVNVVGDAIDEADETFVVNLSNATGQGTILDPQGVGTIVDDEGLPLISIRNSSVLEDERGLVTPMLFSIELNAPSASTITVEASTASGTATSNVDFEEAAGTIIFPPGSMYGSFTVFVVDDQLVETMESFFVNLSFATNALIGEGQAQGFIVDDDVADEEPPPPPPAPECPAGSLCLQNERFAVALGARDHRTGNTDVGLPLLVNDQFGFFSLPGLTGDGNNPEVFIKILDGRDVNGNFWVFYGGLTDLEYTLTVLDIETDELTVYTKPGGSSAGGFDVGSGVTPEECVGEVEGTVANPVQPGACGEGDDRLCLLGGRFRVELTARDQRTDDTAPGVSIPATDLFGYFALPGLTGETSNPEVFVKVLDGTPVNGHYWVFYSGLTDLEYVVTVTDTVTGLVKEYGKAAGSACGAFDTNAF